MRRSRLDTLDEQEEQEQENQKQGQQEAQTAVKDVTVPAVIPVKTIIQPEPVFQSTDIRYRHIDISESIVTEEKMVEVAIEEELFAEPLSEEMVEEVLVNTGRDAKVLGVKVPSVLDALKDPLCLATPPSPHSYSSSPVKSEASSEGRQVGDMASARAHSPRCCVYFLDPLFSSTLLLTRFSNSNP